MRNAVVALLFLAACSSKESPKEEPKPEPKPAAPDPKPTPPPEPPKPAKAEPPAFDFDKLTADEKKDFMKKEVVATMKPLFQAFNQKEFANFGCKTCHGKDPEKTKFKMPNPGLEKLDFAAIKAGKQHPKEAKWMMEVVKPKMAAILQKPEMTETNPKGFGCLGCHEMKK